MFEEIYAPALSSTPSMPSVSIARASIFLFPFKVIAIDNMNSEFLPPLPLPLTVTVVSPPDKSKIGFLR